MATRGTEKITPVRKILQLQGRSKAIITGGGSENWSSETAPPSPPPNLVVRFRH